MKKKVKCSNCGDERYIETSNLNEDLGNILCEICAKASKEECDKRKNM